MRVITVDSVGHFDELMAPDGEFASWAFRGQGDAAWSIWSSLSRHLRSFGVDPSVWSSQEARILRIFKRKAHLHLDHVPLDGDDFQWLSLMQHYGGPTRLLDFTWSPYVAAHFALELAKGDSAVFAVDTSAIGATFDHDLRTPALYRDVYLPGASKVITQGEPALLNRRITAQHGTFIVAGVLDTPLEQLLEDEVDPSSIVKVILDGSVRRAMMRTLYARCVENATLFPDLNGLASSLRYELETHWAYDATDGSPLKTFDSSPYARSLETRVDCLPPAPSGAV